MSGDTVYRARKATQGEGWGGGWVTVSWEVACCPCAIPRDRGLGFFLPWVFQTAIIFWKYSEFMLVSYQNIRWCRCFDVWRTLKGLWPEPAEPPRDQLRYTPASLKETTTCFSDDISIRTLSLTQVHISTQPDSCLLEDDAVASLLLFEIDWGKSSSGSFVFPEREDQFISLRRRVLWNIGRNWVKRERNKGLDPISDEE